ncbi:MAG: hypothetical protein RLZZ598_1832, partial [Pseudomonadota bacterium]
MGTAPVDTRYIDRLIEEGLLLRRRWHSDGNACLLAALSPDVRRTRNVEACPATIMPAWLAHLAPWMTDETSPHEWMGIARRFAGLVRRWHNLDEVAWRRCEFASRYSILEMANRRVKHKRVHEICETVADLCRRVAAGALEPAEREWRAAQQITADFPFPPFPHEPGKGEARALRAAIYAVTRSCPKATARAAREATGTTLLRPPLSPARTADVNYDDAFLADEVSDAILENIKREISSAELMLPLDD